MKNLPILTSVTLASLATAASLSAGTEISREAEISPRATISHEAEVSYSASMGAHSNVSTVRNANVSEQSTHLQYVFGYAVPGKPILRVGFSYDRYDFGFAGPGLIPGALQSLNVIAGLDLKLGDFLIRLEAQPGFYGDNRGFNSSDFNVPIILGASYLVSKDVQWIAGLYFNPNSSSPILGGIGVRWKMSDRWLLNFVPPNPRIEFKATDDLTLYAGGQVISSTFRVNRNMGTGPGGRNYGNALVDFTEIRTGAGASWKMCPKSTLDVELGYMAYRDFDYHKVGENFQSRSGAFYGQMGLKMSF